MQPGVEQGRRRASTCSAGLMSFPWALAFQEKRVSERNGCVHVFMWNIGITVASLYLHPTTHVEVGMGSTNTSTFCRERSDFLRIRRMPRTHDSSHPSMAPRPPEARARASVTFSGEDGARSCRRRREQLHHDAPAFEVTDGSPALARLVGYRTIRAGPIERADRLDLSLARIVGSERQ